MDRSVFDHWVSTDAEAFLLWHFIQGMAAFEPIKTIELGRLIDLKPGQFIFRGPQLADRLNIDRNKIYRLIALFEQDGMITIQKCGRRYSIITVKNNSDYQGESLPFKKTRETNEKPKLLNLSDFEGLSLQESEKQMKNKRETIYKNDKNVKNKEIIDYSLAIQKQRQSFSQQTLILIDRYIDILKCTRRSNKIADSVLFQIYEEIAKYPEKVVQASCSVIINSPSLHSKKENYFFGIMRNTSPEEAEYKLGRSEIKNGKPHKPNGSGYDTSRIIYTGPIKDYGDIKI